MKKSGLIMGLIVVVIIAAVVGLAMLLQKASPQKIQPDPNIKGDKVVSRDYSHMTGSVNAKVTVVEFGDYQCPFCGAAEPTVNSVVDKYRSNPNFNFIFRNFPLSQHPNALPAAEAAEAAGAQGKYFEMNRLLYAHQNDWSGTVNPNNYFEQYAQQLGLDLTKFKNDINSGAYINHIDQDEADGEAWGVNATPTFMLNGQPLSSYTDLDAQVSAALAAK